MIAGAIFGAVVGNFVFRRFPGSAVEWIGSLAAFGAAVPIAVLGAALVACGRRLHIGVASAIGLLLVAWSALDLALGWNSSPTTMLGDLATLPLQHGADAALAAVGAVLALAALAAGLLGIGGLRLEAARRRAELVAEMRFSASVQDLRTVILLRRQLASEHPRRKPWIRLRGTARNPIWRRDWQSFLRWPVVRIVRVVLIAVAAGGLAVGGFDLTPVLFALPGPLLFVAALDLIEPLAQESDHPTRRLLLPFTASELIRRHLWAPVTAMALRARDRHGDGGGRERRSRPRARRRRGRLHPAGGGADLRRRGQRHQRPLRVRPLPAARPDREPRPDRRLADRRLPAAVRRLEDRRRRTGRRSAASSASTWSSSSSSSSASRRCPCASTNEKRRPYERRQRWRRDRGDQRRRDGAGPQRPRPRPQLRRLHRPRFLHRRHPGGRVRRPDRAQRGGQDDLPQPRRRAARPDLGRGRGGGGGRRARSPPARRSASSPTRPSSTKT